MRLGVGDMIWNLAWATVDLRSVARFGFPVQFGVGGPGNVCFFFWNLLRSAQNLLRAIPYFINERVMHTNYIGRYDQSSWGKREHLRNEWICNCLATARFCLTRKNDNVCGRAILSVDAIGIAFNWLKVRCWLLGGGAGFEGVDISFFSNVRRKCIDRLLSYT